MTHSQTPDDAGYAEFKTAGRTLAAVTVAAAFGFPTLAFFSIGIFAPILANEFAWSYASIMSGLFLASCVLLVFSPIVGGMIDHYGTRYVSSISFIAFGSGYMSLALSNGSLALYYGSWLMMSVGGLGATAISFTYIISRSFELRRGLALGIALSSSGLSAMLVKPAAGVLIETIGWRGAIGLIGLLPVLVGAPLLFWGVPRHASAPARQLDTDDILTAPMEGMTLREAVRRRQFWIILVVFSSIAFANGAPIPHLEAILLDNAFTGLQVIQLTSCIGVSLIAGRVFGGWLIDQVWAPFVGICLLTSAAVGCWLLASPSMNYSQAMVAIILLSLAAGVEYDLLSFLVARYLGRHSYGSIYSIIFGVFAIFAGAGPMILGEFYDQLSSYSLGLIICAGMLVAAGLGLLTLGPYPRFGGPEPS